MTALTKPNPSKPIYNLRPDIIDPTDHYYATSEKELPTHISWRKSYPAVYNQLDTNSCTAQSICGAYAKILKNDFSRLFQYYNERSLINAVDSNTGVTLKDMCVAAATYGICREDKLPFNENDINQKPNTLMYKNALKYKLIDAQKINTNNVQFNTLLNTLKNAIFSSNPVILGIVVFPSIETEEVAKTGIVPMPSGLNSPLGGHAIVATGYDDTKQLIEIRNSWGSEWGDDGYGYLPYQYLEYVISSWVIMSIS